MPRKLLPVYHNKMNIINVFPLSIKPLPINFFFLTFYLKQRLYFFCTQDLTSDVEIR